MLTITDPLNNYVYEIHEYMDSDFSGTSPDCQSTTIGSEVRDVINCFILHFIVENQPSLNSLFNGR